MLTDRPFGSAEKPRYWRNTREDKKGQKTKRKTTTVGNRCWLSVPDRFSSSSYRTKRAYLGASPSRKKIAKLCDAIRELTSRRVTGHETEYVVGKLNQKLVGWANYFSVGTVTKAYRAVNYHAANRLRQWLCAKHKVRGPGYSRYPDAFLYGELGLYQLRSKRP